MDDDHSVVGFTIPASDTTSAVKCWIDDDGDMHIDQGEDHRFVIIQRVHIPHFVNLARAMHASSQTIEH